MTESLGALWDGEKHWLEPGEYFREEGSMLVIDGWEELEEEDVLSPFESPSMEPFLRDTSPQWATDEYNKRFPLRRMEQSWASLSVVLSAFAQVAQISKKQYEHVFPESGARNLVKWSFQTDEFITERM